MPLAAVAVNAPASSTEKVLCQHRECFGVLLVRRYDGQWVSRHHGRTIRFRGTLAVEAECQNGHSTSLLIDGERVSVVD